MNPRGAKTGKLGMFSTTCASPTELAREESSPPHKRTRKLDIADVSCLVESRQRASFLSPEKPVVQRHSPLSSSPLSEKPPKKEPTAVKVDVLSQELIEEDGIIQSSLPQYLHHVFGSYIGGSQCKDSGISGAVSTSLDCSAAATNSLAGVSSSSCSDISPPVIQESQGFTVTNITDLATMPVTPATGICGNTLKEEAQELSPLLFYSPTQSPPTNCAHSQACEAHSKTVQTHVSDEKCTHLPVAKSVSKDGKTSKKRKSSTKTVSKKPKYTCPPSCVSLTQLARMKPESLVSVLAIVLQVNSVMEVACKKGSQAGCTVPVASLLLADPTKSCVKLLLWRQAACWVERITAGDIVYFNTIRLKRWKEEVVGHTIMYSKVLNLHQPRKSLPIKLVKMVPVESLECLLEWGKSRHGYLFGHKHSIPTSQRAVHVRKYEELGVESLVHFRARLVAIISERVVLLSDQPGKEVLLYLLGGAWCKELREGVGEVWELQYLAVVLEGTQGNYSLQVTSRSQMRILPADSRDAQAILEQFPSGSQAARISSILISALLECKTSGVRKCMAKATAFNFQLQDDCVLSLHSLSELCSLELVSQLLQAVYVGCEMCAKPLSQDVNCVYCPCNDCIKKTPGGRPSSDYCFRPLVICLSDVSATLEVVANQVVVGKLLGGVKAVDLVRMNLAQNLSQSDAVRLAVVRLLRSTDKDCWILNTVFSVDEYSFVESLTVSLLDCTVT